MNVKPIALFECATCHQTLLRPWLPCDCAGAHSERLIVTPYGAIPAEPLGTGPLEAEQVAA